MASLTPASIVQMQMDAYCSLQHWIILHEWQHMFVDFLSHSPQETADWSCRKIWSIDKINKCITSFVTLTIYIIQKWKFNLVFAVPNLSFSEFFTRNSALIMRCAGAHVTTVIDNRHEELWFQNMTECPLIKTRDDPFFSFKNWVSLQN